MTLPPPVLAINLLDFTKASHHYKQLALTGADQSDLISLFTQMKNSRCKFLSEQTIPNERAI